MKILISDSAFDEGVLQIGGELIIKIITHIETLIDNPDIGQKVPEFNEINIRELIHSPFRIVYLKEEKIIHVIRVWRCERLLSLEDTAVEI